MSTCNLPVHPICNNNNNNLLFTNVIGVRGINQRKIIKKLAWGEIFIQLRIISKDGIAIIRS
jgi:hypothetical protein